MSFTRRMALFAPALLLGGWLLAPPAGRASNEIEAQMYEKGAAHLRIRADDCMKRAEDAPGEMSAVLTKAAENLRALADTKAKIAQKIRSGSWDGLDELKKADEDFTRKAVQLRENLRTLGANVPEGPMMRRMGGEGREGGGFSPAEGSVGGFRPRERSERKPGIVVLNTTDDLRNWLDEEEARGGGAK